MSGHNIESFTTHHLPLSAQLTFKDYSQKFLLLAPENKKPRR